MKSLAREQKLYLSWAETFVSFALRGYSFENIALAKFAQ
jgi:hypothetical protein